MARAQLANNASTTLSAAITATGQTSITVASSSTFPAVTTGAGTYFYATILDIANIPEIVQVTNVSGTTWTIVRGQDGTTARTFASGASVQLNVIRAVLDELVDVRSVTAGGSYNIVLTDRGQSIDFVGGAGATITIPPNASVAFPVGSVLTITNFSSNSLAIQIITDTLRLAGTTTTGNRTLANYGVATLRKVASTTWIIAGSGLT